MTAPRFTIDATDLLHAADALRDLDELAAPIVAQAQVDGAKRLQAAIRRAGARHRSTGKMLEHVQYKVRGDGFLRTVVLYAGGVLAHLVIFGTRPHRIPAPGSPRRAVPVGGRGGSVTGYHGAVTHPGTRPDPWFARGTRQGMAGVQQVADAAADEIASRLARAM